MLDFYSKFVLSVIAAALSLLALQGLRATPAAAQFEGCGSKSDPCYIDYNGYGVTGLPVSIMR